MPTLKRHNTEKKNSTGEIVNTVQKTQSVLTFCGTGVSGKMLQAHRVKEGCYEDEKGLWKAMAQAIASFLWM